MIKLVKFDNKTTYMFPNGEIATPQKITEQFPAVAQFVHVLEVSGDVCQAVMNLNALRNIHNINPTLSEVDAILAIEAIMNTPAPPTEPSAEERIASAMEFQNLMML